MLKPLFIKRKQLNFQKHIGRAKTNLLGQSPRAGPFARRSAPSRRFCARAGARCAVDLMEGLCGPRLGRWCQRTEGSALSAALPGATRAGCRRGRHRRAAIGWVALPGLTCPLLLATASIVQS